MLVNNFYAGYVVLGARLLGAAPGTDLPAYIAPSAEVKINVKSIVDEQLSTASGPLATKVYELTIQNPDGPLAATAAIDSRGRLLRFEIPSAGLRLIRSDLATVSTRTQPIRNPTDTDVIIPAPGFNLAGTLTMPAGVGRLRNPAIVLVAGSGQIERDEVVAGSPDFCAARGLAGGPGIHRSPL